VNKIDRPYEQIEKTVLGSVFLDQPNVPDRNKNWIKNLKTVEETLDTLKALAKIGIEHVIFNMRNPMAEQEPLKIFKEEIIPTVIDF